MNKFQDSVTGLLLAGIGVRRQILNSQIQGSKTPLSPASYTQQRYNNKTTKLTQ